jgi:hypothetical protein
MMAWNLLFLLAVAILIASHDHQRSHKQANPSLHCFNSAAAVAVNIVSWPFGGKRIDRRMGP